MIFLDHIQKLRASKDVLWLQEPYIPRIAVEMVSLDLIIAETVI